MKRKSTYICFAVLAALMLIFYPKDGKFQYEYQKGRPWVYETLIAPFDFPLLKTEAEILKEKEARASEEVDYYYHDPKVAAATIARVSKLAIDRGIDEDLSASILRNLESTYKKGIVSDFDDVEDLSDKIVFIKKGKRATEVSAQELFTVESAYEWIKVGLTRRHSFQEIDSIASLINLKAQIVPDLYYDESTTKLVHEEAINHISPTKGMIYSGQLIVSEGEIVTADICQMLDSFKAEYKLSFGYTGSETVMWLSHLILVLVIAASLFFTLRFADRTILESNNKLIYMLLMAAFAFAATVILYHLDQRLLYLFPFAAMILWSNAFFRDSTVAAYYPVTLLPLMFIPENGIELFVINLVGGWTLLISCTFFNRGWRLFINVLICFAVMTLVSMAFSLSSGEFSNVLSESNMGFLAINATFAVVLHPFVNLFERIFSFVSYSKLWELSDTNNRLLQDLQYKAPGTFQHSLQVANLAEHAAREIGANAMLTRVGALYHDIGKMENPMCFIENQKDGINYHQGLSPEESARAITKHVDDGLALAGKAGLPVIVTDFIATHHGQSLTAYFYNMYCNNGGDPSNKDAFRYHGRLPESKEQVILMMADAVEAASRTLKSYTEESISELVENILALKFDVSQMACADISVKDVNTVKESFKDYLKQIYHARIAYPQLKQQPAEGK